MIRYSNNRTIKNIIELNILLALFIVLYVVAVPPLQSFEKNNIFVILSFFVNGLLWMLFLIYSLAHRPYSFEMMHWLFFLFFFFFAPLIQYAHGYFPWVHDLSDETVLNTNGILLTWSLCFAFGRIVEGDRLKRKSNIQRESTLVQPERIQAWVPVLTIASVLICLWRISHIGLINMLSHGTADYVISDESSVANLIDKILVVTVYYASIFSIIAWKRSRTGWLYMIICLFSLFIAYPPTGISRYLAAAIYLGLLLTIIKSFKKNYLFVILFSLCFIILFPVLSEFRRVSFAEVNILQAITDAFHNVGKMWSSADYDAFAMTSTILKYNQEAGSTLFRQFLGVVLFWIPRTLWPTKPVGSGYFVSTYFGWSFHNVSCPLPAEGLINFGIIGLILFSFVTGILTKWADNSYWSILDKNEISVMYIGYPAFIALFFFILRGDLLSSGAYTASFIVILFVVAYFPMEKIKLFKRYDSI